MGPIATVLLNKPELIIQLGKLGWNTIKNFFHDFDAKDSINYGDAYFDYLQNTVNKNSQIKTLIYNRVPKFLYLFYECPKVQYENKPIETSNAQDILDINSKLIVTGIGGIGKSLLLKHFFLNIAQYGRYIPVLIELRKFNQMDSKEISLYDAIYQNLSDNGFKLEDKYYKYSLDAGGYVILLDGFDEVNRDKAQKVFDQIQSFSQRYNKNHFVVSSRPSDRFVGWNDFHELSLCSLTKKQALNLIQKIDFDETIKIPFYNALDTFLFDKYKSFASNPLLLTIMLLTFNNHASIPEKLNEFYEQAFLTLYNMHDATKDCFVRDIRSHLTCEEFKTVFAHICIRSYFSEDFEFSENLLRQYIEKAKTKFNAFSFSIDDFKEDLTSAVCMLIKDGLHYSFIHRSFQEYFAAWYTRKLPDDDQYTLLTDWISKLASCSSNEYIRMLFDLQDEKVNKIILCPGIKQIKELYDEYGFSCDFLSILFEGININEVHYTGKRAGESYYSIGLTVKDDYLCNIVELTCVLNKHPYSNDTVSSEQEILSRILNKINAPAITSCSFDEVALLIGNDELLHCLQWYHDRLKFCFKLYDKCMRASDQNRNSVASILDNL